MTDYTAQLSESLTLLGGGGDEVDWKAVEIEYGVRFPQDYIDFIANFGEGSIEETLWVSIPTVNTDPMKRRVDRLPEEVLEFPEANEWADPSAAEKYRLEDLLIWGETNEADVLAWITCGSAPEKWPLAVFSRSESTWSVHHCSMTEFLARLLRAEFDRCPISTKTLSGLTHPRFLHAREETRLKDLGINPWSRD
ncbi:MULTISPECIES: SMI1/KNR4 family protein [unclassified Streptomyces]|uniref:SMI1/KNR4 family protein n=1 Tax=unclassified Streptomyces TaxID=2593676 RepID=UPI001BE621BA|nr:MULTISPECIES: SMI1/KNR4 family protein [unclassified Streptomyces]MBT2403238.1 SMI1/KNR4 family protein [Streptomyces sp. ISL-21]MBT2610388.1 SMI1/KNR4 family protein [Streptomyces sp. ISL-87]